MSHIGKFPQEESGMDALHNFVGAKTPKNQPIYTSCIFVAKLLMEYMNHIPYEIGKYEKNNDNFLT